jgi:hypothetical protein
MDMSFLASEMGSVDVEQRLPKTQEGRHFRQYQIIFSPGRKSPRLQLKLPAKLKAIVGEELWEHFVREVSTI